MHREMPPAEAPEDESFSPGDSGDFRVVVPLANPETEQLLLSLASALARPYHGTVIAIHLVEIPDQTPVESGSHSLDKLDARSSTLLERAAADAETLEVDVETRTVFSHRPFREIFDAARSIDADLTVIGWSESHFARGRAEGALDELTHDLPCDFLVLKERGLDCSQVLVPTAGGPDSELSAEVATTLRDAVGSNIKLLHVVDGDQERERGQRFLDKWAGEHGLGGADRVIDTSGDVERAIIDAGADQSLVIAGATERGLLSRLVRGSPAYDIVQELSCSVLLAERPAERSLFERLFGRRDP